MTTTLLQEFELGPAAARYQHVEFKEVVRKRKMVRSFSGEPVAPEAVHRILDVARRGPSAGFSQGVEFVAVPDSRFHLIGGAGHQPWRERPADLQHLLREMLTNA